MSAEIVKEAAQALRDAVDQGDVAELAGRVQRDIGPNFDPPGVVVGPPALLWEGNCDDPTGATFLVYVVVPNDDDAVNSLIDLVPRVAALLDDIGGDVAVRRADPGIYPTGRANLPAYVITVDVSL